MASSCSSIIFYLKCSFSGKTGLSISNSSGVGLSGKFEQLERPSTVCDLSKSCTYDSGNQELHFLSPSVISYLVFTGSAYTSVLPLWIVIGISRIFDKTLTQRPLLIIEKDLPKIAAL